MHIDRPLFFAAFAISRSLGFLTHFNVNETISYNKREKGDRRIYWICWVSYSEFTAPLAIILVADPATSSTHHSCITQYMRLSPFYAVLLTATTAWTKS